jgi:RNA polymerase sigma factor (sigma-70 family)
MTMKQAAIELPPHFFRHEFGRLVSVLSRRFGVDRLELCEDAAQTALLGALQSWAPNGVPNDHGAWLFRVAQNHVLDALRKAKRHERIAPAVARESARRTEAEAVYLDAEVKDDVLRLLFVCADPSLPSESQLILALKTLCGFSTQEIALRLFQGEEAVHKRLQRARARLREQAVPLETPSLAELSARLPNVRHALYLVFNEGYSSAQPDALIRRELCEEALRLTLLLAEHPVGAAAETDALLALMHLHAARFDARVDGAGGLLLLEEQDRTLWDTELIGLGVYYLHRGARGETFSSYHAEAAIAAEHCLAPTFAATNWEEIARLYEILETIAPSPLHVLNRAVAVAAARGPDAGLALLRAIEPPPWLIGYYLWDATYGELYRRRGELTLAKRHLTRALAAAPTNAEKQLLERRLQACQEP